MFDIKYGRLECSVYLESRQKSFHENIKDCETHQISDLTLTMLHNFVFNLFFCCTVQYENPVFIFKALAKENFYFLVLKMYQTYLDLRKSISCQIFSCCFTVH